MTQNGEFRNGAAARSQGFIDTKDVWVVFVFELNIKVKWLSVLKVVFLSGDTGH